MVGTIFAARFALQEVRLYNRRHMEREPEAAKQLLHLPPGKTVSSLLGASTSSFFPQESVSELQVSV